jgi:hypothetical protein
VQFVADGDRLGGGIDLPPDKQFENVSGLAADLASDMAGGADIPW